MNENKCVKCVKTLCRGKDRPEYICGDLNFDEVDDGNVETAITLIKRRIDVAVRMNIRLLRRK